MPTGICSEFSISASPKSKKGKDGEDDDDQPDKIYYAVHRGTSLLLRWKSRTQSHNRDQANLFLPGILTMEEECEAGLGQPLTLSLPLQWPPPAGALPLVDGPA